MRSLRIRGQFADYLITMASGSYQKIGDLMVAEGYLSPTQLDQALAYRDQTGMRFGEVLVHLGFVSESQVMAALSTQFGHDVVDLERAVPQRSALGLVGATFAQEHQCLPLRASDLTLEIVLSDPLDIETIDALARSTRRQVRVFLAPSEAIRKAVDVAYSAPPTRKRSTRRQRDRAALLVLLSGQAQERAA